jgi:hypothetical protein
MCCIAALNAADQPAANLPPRPAKFKHTDLNDDAFFGGELPVLQLVISKENIANLTKNPREFVELTLREKGAAPMENCSVKLKGSAGSFRQITEDRPGFSIRTAKSRDQEFHGLSKFMLNNCAQDGTMLHEQMAGEMARAAGVPASRCGHAYVTLNNKLLGTYVVKEGFNKEFLTYFFANTKGHLYDGGFCSEINPDMQCEKGDPRDKSSLLELIGSFKEQKADIRMRRMDRIVDIDAYLRYVALEEILCHWDGYSFNRNNYRIYEDPASGKFYFFLHGMDQMFGDNRWYIYRRPGADVANAIWAERSIRDRFRAQFFEVYEKTFKHTDWSARTIKAAAEVQAKLVAIDPEEAKRFVQRGKDAAGEISRRLDGVKAQLEDADNLNPPGGKAVLKMNNYAWAASSDKGDTTEKAYDGHDCLQLEIAGQKGGDFQLPLSLARGHYRLNAQMKTAAVKAGTDPKQKGATLKVLWAKGLTGDSPGESRAGDNGWTDITIDFEVLESDPTLSFEFRGGSGTAWLDRNSVSLTRLR